MGLPGSGKTTFANALAEKLGADRINADEVRKETNNWDFSFPGRLTQAAKMTGLSLDSQAEHVVVDFVAPLPEFRELFNPDMLIWMNTIDHCQFEDTNEMFSPPLNADITVTDFDYSDVIESIVEKIS
jgi:adenylylsulfate kinase